MLYIMLCGSPPFNGSDDQIIAKVKKEPLVFRGQVWQSISEEAKDLVEKLMDRDVEARLSAVDALAHPWIEQKVQKKFNEKLASKAVSSLSNFHVRLNFIYVW